MEDKHMTRWLAALAGLVALAGAGCIKMDQDLTINADGSADMKLHYAMTEQAITQLEAMKQMAAKNPDMKVETQGPELAFDEAQIKAEFEKKKGEGVELKSVRVEAKDGWKHAYIEARCKDLAAAAKAGKSGGNQGGYALTKNADGDYVLEMAGAKMGGGKAPEKLTAEQKAQQQAMMKTMMAGLKVTLRVSVPGDVVETTGEKKDARTAEWVLDISDAKFFEKSEAMEKNGPKVVFSGKGLDLKEFKAEPKAEKAPGKTGEPN
jgi:hypothetical protein